jgi:FMN phosphatase YigB (HAD superfamily)
LQKDYKFDASFYGSLNEYSKKIAYFFHASLQSTVCFPGAAAALRQVADRGLVQGLLGDGQVFTAVQLQRSLAQQDPAAKLDELVDPELHCLSYEVRGRKPSERLFRHALSALEKRNLAKDEVLHVASRLAQDLVPAKRLGMRTAFFVGDKAALEMPPDELKRSLKDPLNRPDVLLTELNQIAEIVSG